MKKIIWFLLLMMSLGLSGFSQTFDCSISEGGIIVAEKTEALAISTANICPGQTKTFCTPAVAGAIYSWSVTGGSGIQIIGPSNGPCVTVSVTAAGNYQLCLYKSINGINTCCVCIPVVCGDCCPPCPLKLIMSTPTCYGLSPTLSRGRFQVVCVDGSTLTNWITSNGVTGTIRWETLNIYNGGFNGSVCGEGPVVGPPGDVAGFRWACYPLSWNSNTLESSWYRQSNSLSHNPYVQIKATVTFNKNGCVCVKEVLDVFYVPCCEGVGSPPCAPYPEGRVTKAEILNDWTVSPNPGNGNFSMNIDLKENAAVAVHMVSQNGAFTDLAVNKVLTAGKHRINFNPVKKITAGNYSLVFYANGRIIDTKNLSVMQ